MLSPASLLRRLAAPPALLVALTLPAAASAAGFGAVTGAGGCLGATNGSSHCTPTRGIFHPKALAVSPDGRNVYVVGGEAEASVARSFGAIAILRRDPESGALKPSGCVSSDGSDGSEPDTGDCASAPALLNADGVTVSPDGSTVYVTAAGSAAVSAFARDPETGALSRLGCLQDTPRPGSPCTGAEIFPHSGEILATSSALYIAAPDEGTISGLAPKPPSPVEGGQTPAPESPATLFTAAPGPYLVNSCIAVNGLDGACAIGTAMHGVEGLALAPGGAQLYAAASASSAIDVLTPGAGGTLVQKGCLIGTAPKGICSTDALLVDPTALAVTPDGHNIYVADGDGENGRLNIVARATDGSLTGAGCVDEAPARTEEEKESKESEEEEEPSSEKQPAPADPCAQAPGLLSPIAVTSNADGSAVYVFGDRSAAAFSRDPATGKLTEVSCAASEDAACSSLPSLDSVDAAAVSPDGHNVYVISGGDTVQALGVGAAVATGSATASRTGLTHVSVACPPAMAGPCRGRLLLARSQVHRVRGRRHVRVTRVIVARSAGFSVRPGEHARIALRVDRRARRLLRLRRRIRLEAIVSAAPDGGGSGFGRALSLRLTARS